ncbi:hypothetical protein [Deinococcus sp. 12RED42]|uniref:hypothetical protein n=1 Tax=Deinococcus sp. 12RED42 TaxID=2745872 RepID=UPI001E2D5938|nr:hypothetical protein [Deinococcus sp. 12RED42]MCD0166374.1 hypothetical protein [Deinococcus sp. 12RED42]
MTESRPPAVELRIYPDFSEVRTLVQSEADQLELTFPATTWASVDTESITLIGLPYASKTVVARESWLTAFEGRRVGLRTPHGTEEVTLIRADDLVVQNANGAYFHASQQDLLLPEAPPPQGQRGVVSLSFALRGPGEGVLTYLTRSLTWSAQYQLDVDGQGGGVLRADATLHNRGDLPLEPEVLTLVAGDVRRSRPAPGPESLRHVTMHFARNASPAWEDPEDAPEVAGLYRYQLLNPPRLAGGSDVTVPFEDVPLHRTRLTNVLSLSMSFASEQRGVFQRRYSLVPERPLLEARVTVRDQGYLVGQPRVGETAAGQEVEFTLGQDPNVTYHRTVTLLSSALTQDVDRYGEPVTRTVREYRVTYRLRNAGRRPVEFEVTERTGYVTLVSVTGPAEHHFEEKTDAVTFRGALPPAGDTTVEFEVTVRED